MRTGNPSSLTPTDRARCEDVAAFCEAWHQHVETWWTSNCLDHFVEHDPQRAWKLIVALLESASQSSQWFTVGGVVADLLELHSKQFLPIVLDEARRSAPLRTALEAIDISDCNHDEIPNEVLEALREFFASAESDQE